MISHFFTAPIARWEEQSHQNPIFGPAPKGGTSWYSALPPSFL